MSSFWVRGWFRLLVFMVGLSVPGIAAAQTANTGAISGEVRDSWEACFPVSRWKPPARR